MKSIYTLAVQFVLIFLFLSCAHEPIQLVILSSNDVHSRVNAYLPTDKKYGNKAGFAQKATFIKTTRKENNQLLLLDAGDISQGTPFYNTFGLDFQIECMNKMGYDAMTIGNHEFDNGMEALAKGIKKAKFPVICSNYDFTNTELEGLTKPYLIITKGKLKIGIIGVGVKLDGLVSDNNKGKTKYLDPIERVNYFEKFLTEKGCNYIIILSHLGFEMPEGEISDKILAKNTININLIIGGHTHTFMNEPYYELNRNGNKVSIIQSGYNGLVITKTLVNFEKNKISGASIYDKKN